ncbi:unnamed protein product [Didymodactylos carnosus]|uniref:Uncharacterized protein n=1 Tax=Didymodactylos carnosus TaxID=1234261 RepID=A0A814JD90_9BILA|nr:unnamed protein product [Didymodactylos carnosus]CAF1239983.1 unnamed protein product [Didymodactylos carnosus]CAF3805897.1 unnamed protein product [Didymodactylos carnosus]CAF4047419.1 unnamed protein product [Didymodactylos carnosus]
MQQTPIPAVLKDKEFWSNFNDGMNTVRRSIDAAATGDMHEKPEKILDKTDLLVNTSGQILAVICRQMYELVEFTVPRFFIIMPEEMSIRNPTQVFFNNYRLFFICECDNKSDMHLAYHDGYPINRPREFFLRYGSYIRHGIQRMRKTPADVIELLGRTLALEANQILTTLDISCNEIGHKGAKALGKALESNQTLAMLNISQNTVAGEGDKALGKALESNQTLTTFDISRNAIGDDGVKVLTKAIESNQTLKALNISGKVVGDEGAEALGKALESNQTLI